MDVCGRPQAIANTKNGPCEISEDPDNPLTTGVSEISSPISQHSIKLLGFKIFQNVLTLSGITWYLSYCTLPEYA